jgi:hypothetical protein
MMLRSSVRTHRPHAGLCAAGRTGCRVARCPIEDMAVRFSGKAAYYFCTGRPKLAYANMAVSDCLEDGPAGTLWQ